ncbi:MAG: HAMP domain-containing histidine kinase [Chromatiales bacterium]|nr:HAMP domain-containing histidine kinase [Chromatiales bacterium]
MLAVVAMIGVFHWNYQRSIEVARREFALDADRAAAEATVQIGNALREIYQALRTAARLPAVRRLDPGSDLLLEANARQTLEELYRNLAANVAVSEVYLIPVGFDPDAIDPRTGRYQTAALEYDQLISRQLPHGGRASSADVDAHRALELDEWREMRSQMRWLAARYPRSDALGPDTYPATASPEVVTCDTSVMSTASSPLEARKGFVYSVPVYGQGGDVSGMVSAVIRTAALAALLPGGGQLALYNADHRHVVLPLVPGQAERSRAWVARGEPDPALGYSRVLDVPDVDRSHGWLLWAGIPDAVFESSAGVLASRRVLLVGTFGSILVGTFVALWLRASHRDRVELEARVRQRTAELARAHERERRFTGDAAHELRTPLAALALNAELARSARFAGDREDALDRIRHGVDEATHLVDQLLTLARLDPDQPPSTRVPIRVVDIVDEVAMEAAPRAHAAGIRIVVDVDTDSSVPGLAPALRAVVRNLLDNALRHAGPGGRVRMTLREGDGAVLLTVADSGPGIPHGLRERVFDRFFRATERTSPGAGLGLSIVKRVVDIHGGSVAIEDAEELGGAALVVRLPTTPRD